MRASWRLSKRTARLVTVVLFVMVLVVVGALVHPPFVVLRAGPAVNTLGDLDGTAIISVEDAKTYPTQGALDFTTVAQYGGPGFEINGWFLLSSLFDPGSDVVPRDEVFPPNVTRESLSRATSAQMASSHNSAEAVVFNKLGFEEVARVASVVPSGPAQGVLREGDVITSVDGQPISRTAQVAELVRQRPDGSPVKIGIDRGGSGSVVEVTPKKIQGRMLIGVGLEARFPKAPKVQIRAGDVGGPSAGTMFALGLYDKLTPGALTGGQRIAGTGTMSLDGTVGPIGGITHKMDGARAASAEWFLAPAKNCSEVVGNVPEGLRVVKVDTFDEALRAVESIGAGQGDSLPTCG
ncbi:ATP-dependent protease Lon [Dermatophilus congolensis]|uniref:endopeptidase La n=1 Tax=Dermatophilus congolensis TaxID=1863 RepID=A0A239VQT8_9MICO|nr:ATP-dependent protease Lon [Dermatophilus congolensis]